jgi:hypothetical protein
MPLTPDRKGPSSYYIDIDDQKDGFTESKTSTMTYEGFDTHMLNLSAEEVIGDKSEASTNKCSKI